MTEDLNTLREALELAFEETDSCIVANKCQKALAALSRLEAAAVSEENDLTLAYMKGFSDGKAAAVPELSREDVVRLTREAADYANAEYPRRQFAKDPITWWQLRDGRFASLVRSVPVGGQS